MSDVDTLTELVDALKKRRQSVARDNAYYDGAHRLSNLGVSIPPELRGLQTVLNWPRLVVSVYAERLEFDNFRVAGNPELSARLRGWAARNDLSDQSALGHTEALTTGRAYIVIGERDDDPDTPLITVESAASMYAKIDPRTREVVAAVRLYGERDNERATLYLPGATRFYRYSAGGWVPDPAIEDIEHGYGFVPVEPLVNRARIDDRDGRSEFADIIDLTDAAARTLTNLQAAQEFLAVPQRVLLGVDPDQFVDEDGNATPAWEMYIGRILALTDEQAKVHEFRGADLSNFTSTIVSYARQAAGLTGIPMRYLGIASEANPASADAIRADESRLIRRSEQLGKTFAPAWERAFRKAARILDGEANPALSSLEVVYRDPATTTRQALADAALKLSSARTEEGPLFPREYIWEFMGLSAEQIEDLRGRFETDAISQLLAATDNDDDLTL